MFDFLPALRLANIFNNPSPDENITNPNITDSNITIPANQSNIPTPNPADDISNRIAKIYTPEHAATDRFNKLLANYPTDKGESVLSRIAAALAGAATTYATSTPRSAGDIGEGISVGKSILDDSRNKAIADWKNQIVPTQQAANLERQSNVNERQLAYQTVSEQLRNESLKHKEENDEKLAKIKQQRADVYEFKAKNPTLQLKFPKGGNIQSFNPVTGELKDLGVPTGTLSDTDKLALQHDERTAEIHERGDESRKTENLKQEGREKVADTRGWTPLNIPDPEDPTKSIGVMVHGATGEVRPITLNGKQVGSIGKPGTSQVGNVTQSTKTMMEGATMLRPHINDLRSQAEELNKRGLFGPVMSRIREYAAKIGTTGSPEQVQQSLEDFSNAIGNDPRINASNDRLVGEFVTNLGLMASGTGRVHGGARGGGSIQMVNNLKSLLSSNSTLDMFQGRLDSLDSYLKTYSAGPTPANTKVQKSKLDKAIDDILAGVK